MLGQARAVADEGVGAQRALVEDPPGHGPDVPPQVEGVAGGDQRARARGGLDHQGAGGEGRDRPVAHREVPGPGEEAAGELRDHGAPARAISPASAAVAAWGSPPPGRSRARRPSGPGPPGRPVSRGVDAPGEAGDDGDPGRGEGAGEGSAASRP